MKYSIVIPTYNHLEDCLIPCVESILQYTSIDPTNAELVIVANGCTDGTKDYIKGLQQNNSSIQLVWLEAPSGYTTSTNEGIKITKGDYIVLLNNDTVLLPQSKNDWLEAMVKPFEEQIKVAVTGPMVVHCPYANINFAIFFCVMIKKTMFEELGLLDEIFSPGIGEDCAFCAEALLKGYRIVQVPAFSDTYYAENRMVGNFPIYHHGEATFANWPGGEELLRKNREILKQRYNKPQVDISRAQKCDGWISDHELMWLAEQARNKSLAVEIGSWHGRSARAIADHLPEQGVLYCIDTWNGSEAEKVTFHSSAKMMEGDHAFYEFLENHADLIQQGKVIPLRMKSKNAAKFFKERNIKFDFIFIDAGHTYEEVKEDILAWKDLVKKDGVLCGHDYYSKNSINTPNHLEGVQKAVEEIFEEPGQVPETSIWIAGKQKSIPSVHDCFIFNNELDILETRLQELYDVVDRFVIVEATKTHAGKDKPLNFHNNLGRFEKYLSKITYIVMEDYPSVPDTATITDKSWAIERHQRDCIMRALKDCKDNDVIIISDCDEIPSKEAIQNYRPEQGIRSFEMDLYYYNYSCKSVDKWLEAKILPYSALKQLTPCGARYTTAEVISKGGKHLSYFGGVDSVIKKIEDTAHQELNTPTFKDRERIERLIKEGKDLFDRDYVKFETV